MKKTASLVWAAAATIIPGLCLAGAAAAPSVPTGPPSAQATITLLQQVCLPLIKGGDLDTIAKANHLRRKDGQWTLIIDRNRRLVLDPPDTANPRICSATIRHAVGSGPAIQQAIDDWARSSTPALTRVKVDETSTGPSYLRTTSTWSGPNPMGTVGVALSEEKTLKGAPVDGALDQSEIEISITPKAT